MNMPDIDDQLIDLENWREIASCRFTSVSFFPSPEDAEGIGQAKAVCAQCPVIEECLAYAIETNQAEGVWGGTTARERVKLRRRWLESLRRAS
jgi:WhiB family redox-sensing transcriptional regulator